ncbi:hypothetical protein SARC_05007 [Sphaeroforma arctica JP610]|uniref:J domain-containing protein n=1 Tax=Sphaeroforma arctica JP610 TaxID=667725 RepID=A0A0L0G1L3_9EUKA|nr:hypothetical protein SARC_05007 [Sphaeroforma arctica JP610]KNC82706.1 hypothetical protein SARC_05007 [Sphaeroforma arctica JP610]|eukprot:XP_014156608.1 hypothetical protein SARC_05007 [Sphaeroforma arctica JP610]
MAECNCRGKCATCPCAKAKDPCTDACHKGSPNESCINFQEALQVKAMSVSEIRKALASYGLSPIGDKSELMPRLAHHLRNQKGDSAVKEETPSAGAGGGNAKTLIDDIIRYQDEHAILLSLAGVPITSASSVAAMRKAYLKLSLKIHPDKHDSSAESKAAFQALVNAFDTLSNPEEEDDDVPSGKRKKAERVERSNDNCYETHIYCPKCHIPWNTPDLGLEKGAYNFFMMGIKQYGCGGCLLRFGCVTAVHHCPLCDKEFDYDPSDYHRQINCGNAKCTGKFGFWYHPVSALRERRIRSEVKAEQEKEHKRRNQRIRRAGRAKDRAPGESCGPVLGF